jgi:pimeloyl-ACP methyl ester carboxylesterase
MAAFGDDVAAVVRHLGLGEVVLIGYSMGGDVVVETALCLGGQVLGVGGLLGAVVDECRRDG